MVKFTAEDCNGWLKQISMAYYTAISISLAPDSNYDPSTRIWKIDNTRGDIQAINVGCCCVLLTAYGIQTWYQNQQIGYSHAILLAWLINLIPLLIFSKYFPTEVNVNDPE